MRSCSDPNTFPTDSRGLAYTHAYIDIKRLRTGQFYLISIRDKDGDALRRRQDLSPDGARECAGRAVWLVTPTTGRRSLIRNMPWASRSSQIPEMAKNGDGSARC